MKKDKYRAVGVALNFLFQSPHHTGVVVQQVYQKGEEVPSAGTGGMPR